MTNATPDRCQICSMPYRHTSHDFGRTGAAVPTYPHHFYMPTGAPFSALGLYAWTPTAKGQWQTPIAELPDELQYSNSVTQFTFYEFLYDRPIPPRGVCKTFPLASAAITKPQKILLKLIPDDPALQPPKGKIWFYPAPGSLRFTPWPRRTTSKGAQQ